MKKSLFLLLVTHLLCASCDSGDSTAYKDLIFGMPLEEVIAKGYCSGDKTISEEGLETYRCIYSDFAECNYEKCELSFQEGKLAKVHFFNSTTDAERQRDISKKVRDYLTSRFGQPKEVNRCNGWKDDKRTYIQYIHVDDATFMLVNELAIFGNDYYKTRK